MYLGHHKFLSRLPKRRPHPYRKMIKQFHEKIENDRAHVPWIRVQMFEKLKDKRSNLVKENKIKLKKKKKKRRKKSGRRDLFFGILITGMI
jgi:hypothetical protein